MSEDSWVHSLYNDSGAEHLVATRGAEGYEYVVLAQIYKARTNPAITEISLNHRDLFTNDAILAAVANLIASTFKERSWTKVVFAQAIKAPDMAGVDQALMDCTIEQSVALQTFRSALASKLEVEDPNQLQLNSKIGFSKVEEGVPMECAIQSDKLSLQPKTFGSTPTPASEPTAAPASTPASRPVPTPASVAAGKVKDEDMRAEFNRIDVDKNGFIEAKDFKAIFGSFAPTSMVNKALSYVDKNGDKKISFEEYKAARARLPIKIPGITK